MEYYILTLEEALEFQKKSVGFNKVRPMLLKTGEYAVPSSVDELFPELKTKQKKTYGTDKLPDGYVYRTDSYYKIDDKGKLTKEDKVFNNLYKDEEEENLKAKEKEEKEKEDKEVKDKPTKQ